MWNSNKKYILLFLLFLNFPNYGICGDNKSSIDIGVMVDSSSREGAVADICLSMSYDDFYSRHSHYKTRLSLHKRNATGVLSSASTALDLLNNVGVHAIIGPQRSEDTTFVLELGERAHVPILSFSATTPSLSPSKRPYFIRTTQVDTFQLTPIMDILTNFKWHEIVLIHEDTDYGNAILPYLTDALQQVNIRLSNKSSLLISSQDLEIQKELTRLNNMWTRVFLVHITNLDLASKLFVLAKQMDMMSEGYAWIITSGLSTSLDSINSKVMDSMEGVLGIRPHVPKSIQVNSFNSRWKKNQTDIVPNTFCYYAYDTISALAMAVEKIQSPINTTFLKLNDTNDTSSGFSNMGVSQIGQQIYNETLKIRFKGLSGDFMLVDGELERYGYDILNLFSKGEKVIGYWSTKIGLSGSLSKLRSMKPIIWPGYTIEMPKGWTIPTNGKVLRVGIPYKGGFREFVNLTIDPRTNSTNYTGFSIDFFRLVWANLTYKSDIKFETFTNQTGGSAGSYDDLVCSIGKRGYDFVVGDITIVANRTKCVDFTMPYSDSGITMLVPNKQQRKRQIWDFLKPLSWDLWLAIIVTCMFIGLAIKILERRASSSEFSGSPKRQISMIFWLPFQAMVIPERHAVVNRFSRIVLVMWLFLAFVLMQSYTASLSSILVVDQLKPSYESVKTLRDKGRFIGYQTSSFVEDFLIHELNFDSKKLKSYDSIDMYHKALVSGEVAAIFDEIPYLKVFIGKYPNYSMAGETYRAKGFGFGFPLGSPLAASFSSAILNVVTGTNMTDLENHYFGSYEQHDKTSGDSPNLNTSNFGGLFIITGVATTLAVIISEFYIMKTSISRKDDKLSSSKNESSPFDNSDDINNVSAQSLGGIKLYSPRIEEPRHRYSRSL